MPLLDFRLRTGYLFLAAVVIHIVLISAQVNARSGVPILEAITFGAFAEVQRATSAVLSGVRIVWTGYIDLRSARRENAELRRELAEAQVRLQQQQALADRTAGLLTMLELHNSLDMQTTAAQIIGSAANPEFRTVTIDKGQSAGLRKDMAVLAPSGVVGRVVVAAPRASRVQLIIDRNAAVGAMVARSRAQGVLVGSGDGRLQMEYVSETSDVTPGDTVTTSGIDGIYPKGIVVGQVEAVEKSGGAYRRITVRPAVDFSTLEDVLVVTTPTAADAPVPEKPQ